MVVATRPVSSQSANTRRNYQERLSEEACGWFRERPRLAGSLYLRIIWFQRSPTKQDTDNIARPISDALNGLICDDDNRITKYLIERILYSLDVRLLSNTVPAPVYKKLVSLIGHEEADIFYIEVGDASAPGFYFGPFVGCWRAIMSVAADYLEAAKLDELAAEFRRAGYHVRLNDGKGSTRYDLTAEQGKRRIAVEVIARVNLRDDAAAERVSTLREHAYSQGFDEFRLVLVSPPRETMVEVDGLADLLFRAIVNDIPSELDILSSRTQIRSISDIDITFITINKEEIQVAGTGIVLVELVVRQQWCEVFYRLIRGALRAGHEEGER